MYNIYSNHEKLSIEVLKKFESENKIKLPDLYRDFLLRCNGGLVEPNVFLISEDQGETALNVFYGVGSMRNNLAKKMDFFDDIVNLGLIPIASDSGGNQICLGLSGEYSDKIYFWSSDNEYDRPEENLTLLANDLNDFLERLHESA